jgi:hypothetical protein
VVWVGVVAINVTYLGRLRPPSNDRY